ncbi:MAG: SRPBCC family protein [Alphaproteobacteria bacterium]|nr:SRPBCC family protein [Alphaproteobacteria bacterium]
MAEPVTLTWELSSPAPIERVWRVLSDTDRFNKVAELGFRFESEPQPDGSVKRTGRARFLGLDMTWEELPFQYRAPEWFRVVRRFHGTPAEEVVTTLRLRRTAKGTDIRYTVAVTPRTILARPLVSLELNTRTRPKLDRALNYMLAELVGTAGPILGGPPPLGPEANARLTTLSADLGPPGFGEKLSTLLRTAPLREQDNIAPLRLAKAWNLLPEQAVPAFLDAVRVGVLSLRWDLICPSCQGPAARMETLGEPERRVHCSSCNVYFDGTFPDSVAVTFRPAPAIRDFDVPVECIGSPGRQRHMLAQERFAPGEQAEVALELPIGPFRLRTWPPLETASVEVRPDAADTELRVVAKDGALTPPRLRAAPGLVKLLIHNDTDRPLRLVLEQLERPPDVLTAGQLLDMPGARDLLPEQAVDPSLAVESLRAGAVLLPHPDDREATRERFEAAVRTFGPRCVVSGERGTLATWPSFDDALRAGQALMESLGTGAAVSSGTLLEVGLVDEVVPMGSVVDGLLRMLPCVAPGVLAAPIGILEDAEVAATVRREGLAAVELPWDVPGVGVIVALAPGG